MLLDSVRMVQMLGGIRVFLFTFVKLKRKSVAKTVLHISTILNVVSDNFFVLKTAEPLDC